MNMIKVHIHGEQFTQKPSKGKVGKISTGIANKVSVVSPQEIAEMVGLRGQTIVLAVIKKGKPRQKAYMESQQMLMLDFDSGQTTIQDMLNDRFVQDNASFIYKTFSYTPEHERFRVAFILDEPLISNDEVSSAYDYLFEKYPDADKVNRDSSRLFFGGNGVKEVNYNNTLSKESIPVKVYKVKERRKSTAPVQQVRNTNNYETPTWKLIVGRREDEVKARWRMYGEGQSFENRLHAKDFFRSLDMAEMLGVSGNPFYNIFEYEENPSASIWMPKNSNTYLYTELNRVGRNGNKMTYDIVQVIEKLLGIPHLGALQYLVDNTGVDFEISDELRAKREEIDMVKGILSSGTLKEQYPDMYQIFGRYNHIPKVVMILDIMKENMRDYNGETRMITWMSAETIARRINSTPATTKRVLNLMAYTGLVDKLPDDQVPVELLETIKKNQTHRYDEKQKTYVQRKRKHERRSTVFEVPRLGERLQFMEDKTAEMVENNFSLRGLTREMIIRTDGIAEADRVFPQDTERTISKASREATEFIHKEVTSQISEKGYIIVNELLDTMHRIQGSKSWVEMKFKQQEAELLEAYDLEKHSLTNAMKEEYNITHLPNNSRPQVIVRA